MAIAQQLLHIPQHLRVLLDLGLITSATLRRVTRTAKPPISVSKLSKKKCFSIALGHTLVVLEMH